MQQPEVKAIYGQQSFEVSSREFFLSLVHLLSLITEERVAKADLRGKRGRKNDTFVTTSSLDAARCAVGGWKTEGERGGSWFPLQNIKPELYCSTCEHLQQN